MTGRAEPSSFSRSQDAGGAVPGDVQHVRRAAVQLRPDRRRGGERDDPHVGGVLAGGADRGQHVAQFPLIIQHRPAARSGAAIATTIRSGPGSTRAAAASVLRYRLTSGCSASGPRPSGLGSASHGNPASSGGHRQAQPHRLMRPLRRRQHPPQLAATGRAGTIRPAAGRPGSTAAPRRPGLRPAADRQAGPVPGPAHLVDRLSQARPTPP